MSRDQSMPRDTLSDSMSVKSVALDTPFEINTVICISDSDGEGAVDISTGSIEISRQI